MLLSKRVQYSILTVSTFFSKPLHKDEQILHDMITSGYESALQRWCLFSISAFGINFQKNVDDSFWCDNFTFSSKTKVIQA